MGVNRDTRNARRQKTRTLDGAGVRRGIEILEAQDAKMQLFDPPTGGIAGVWRLIELLEAKDAKMQLFEPPIGGRAPD